MISVKMNMRKTSCMWFPKLIFMVRMNRIKKQLDVVGDVVRSGKARFMLSTKSDMKGRKKWSDKLW